VRYWTCQRVVRGKKCAHKQPARYRNCRKCGKPRPVRKRPAHMAALDESYEHYIEINGGEHCGICGRSASPMRRLDRDHDHNTGLPRGLLCFACNRQLRTWATIEWLLAAAAYLRRHLERAGRL
jgi:Recombination endonuclease VII